MKIYALLFFVVLAINLEAVFGHVLRRRIGGSVSRYDREDMDDDSYGSYGGRDDDRYGTYGGRYDDDDDDDDGDDDDDDDDVDDGYDTYNRHDHYHYNYGNPYSGYLSRRTSPPIKPPEKPAAEFQNPKKPPLPVVRIIKLD